MPANQQPSDIAPRRNKTNRLRVVGVLILLLGLIAAGAVYEIQTHARPTDDELLTANARAQSRQMGILYGKLGVLTQELAEDLRQPGTQACLIAAVSVLAALGCFYVARLSEDDDKSD